MNLRNVRYASPKSQETQGVGRTKYLVAIFTAITVLALLVPFAPDMPMAGLDPSWRLAMNAAIAQNLNIGKEIIFTFGPYSSVYTGNYHPATDKLMLCGALLLASCYTACLFHIAKRDSVYPLLGLLFFFTAAAVPPDVIFLSYPLLLVPYAQASVAMGPRLKRSEASRENVGYDPLGLLPLIKGSFLFLCGLTTILLAVHFSTTETADPL